MRSSHVRHDRLGEAFPYGQRFHIFEDGDVELCDGRFDASQWRILFGKARVEDALAGGIIDQRVQLADHLGVRHCLFSRCALRKRVPDCGVYPNRGGRQRCRSDGE